jgi:hypothetical protein
MKSAITISRKWDNPEIKTILDSDGISVSIDLADFISALKSEIGSVATIVTKETFSKRFDDAVYVVLEGMKEETIKVV